MSESEMEPVENIKKPKRKITEKQLIARKNNLAKGRQARAQKLAKLKEAKEIEKKLTVNTNTIEYDNDSLSDSDESSLSSSEDEIVISKRSRKKISTRQATPHPSKSTPNNEISELKKMLLELKKEQAKEKQKTKRRGRGGGKTIVQVVNPAPQQTPTKKEPSSALKTLCKWD